MLNNKKLCEIIRNLSVTFGGYIIFSFSLISPEYVVARFYNFLSVTFPLIYFGRGLCTQSPDAPGASMVVSYDCCIVSKVCLSSSSSIIYVTVAKVISAVQCNLASKI
jgi:hypothetical protein